MSDDKGPLNGAFGGGLAIGASIVAFIAFLLAPFDFKNYCTEGESVASCYREWLMMIGGWGAVAGGGLAAFYVYRTLEEMKRQTAFMLGDEMPTLELLSTSAFHSPKFRIVNWNRRTFLVQDIVWSVNQQNIPLLDLFEDNSMEATVTENSFIYPSVRVPGWEDRGGPPPSRTLSATTASGQEWEFPDEVWESLGVLTVKGQFAGAPNRQCIVRSGEIILDIVVEE